MTAVANELATPHLTSSYDRICPNGTPDKSCVYTEKLEGEKIASRSFRVVKLTEVRDEYLVYTGDINGDGIPDQFKGRFYYFGNGLGEVSFGQHPSNELPATFRNAAGQTLRVGQKITAHEVYGGKRSDEITGFKILVGSPYGAQVPEYALITVQAILKSGEIFNIDQLETR